MAGVECSRGREGEVRGTCVKLCVYVALLDAS